MRVRSGREEKRWSLGLHGGSATTMRLNGCGLPFTIDVWGCSVSSLVLPVPILGTGEAAVLAESRF